MKSSSRNGHKVRVLALHSTEGIMRAADLRAWTAWAGSSHAAADETGVLLHGAADGFVDYNQASWTLRSGNPWSENIELCAKAGWTRAQWLARPKLLDRCAYWLAIRSKARGIPLRKLTATEYRAGQSGVIDHNDHTIGYRDGTHWDVGPGFPWDVVMAAANRYANPPQEDIFMALNDAEQREILTLARSLRTELDFTPHHGRAKDDAYGHLLSVRQWARRSLGFKSHHHNEKDDVAGHVLSVRQDTDAIRTDVSALRAEVAALREALKDDETTPAEPA